MAAPYGYNNYNNYNYAYEPVVTERVVTRPAVTVYGARNGYAVRDAYARVEGPAREVVDEVDAAPRLTCKQRFRRGIRGRDLPGLRRPAPSLPGNGGTGRVVTLTASWPG